MSAMLANLNVFLSRVVVLLWTFSVVSSQSSCSSGGSCFPARFDIASKHNVTVNSTCGDPAEQFCDLSSSSCSAVCNANDPTLKHPASFINDDFGLGTYWKSKNVERPVFIEFDFGAVYMLYQSIIRFQFAFPSAMYVAKSSDYGVSYQVMGYFSTDCQKYFGKNETSENRRNGMATECFKIDTGVDPKVVNYNPMKDPVTGSNIAKNHSMQIHFLMTNLRVVLDWYITPSNFDPTTASDTIKKQLYFSVQNIDVLGSCFCNGQASQCNTDKPSRCTCEKNTDGNNCEKCLPLFNNRLYSPRQACEDCGCNNHSASCTYNATNGYGVCNNCTDNTMGEKCELCKPKFYRNSNTPINHTSTCLDCGCNLNGVRNTTNNTHCDSVTGQCDCKPNVEGRACDTCRDTLWNLGSANPDGCQDCSCTLAGTVNASNICHKVTGQCKCKPAVMGRACDTCKDGFYSLQANNTAGCSACECDPAGSRNISCDSSGTCFCRPHFSGVKCDRVDSGYFAPGVDSLTFQAEKGQVSPVQEKKIRHSMVTDTAGQSQLFVGVVLREGSNVTNPTRLTTMATIPRTAYYDITLRYQTSYNWQSIKTTLTLRTLFSSFSCDGGITMVTTNTPTVLLSNLTASDEGVVFGSTCLLEGSYSTVVEIQPGSAGANAAVAELILDSVVVYPSVSKYPEYERASATQKQNISHYHGNVPNLKSWSGQAALGCQVLSGFYGYLYQEGQACACNVTGANNPSICAPCGGQCSCKPYVIGRACQECQPDYYGYGTGLGCTACNCSVTGSQRSSCQADSGQCECKPAVIGRQCSRCQTNYYNFTSRAGCTPCGCNTDYSRDLQCHDVTGTCTCKPGVNGAKCTECADANYNLTTSGCTSCGCNSHGSINAICNKTTGQCPCRPQALGRVCNDCPSGYYGLGSRHPDGCPKCQCSGKTTNCSSASGYAVGTLTSELPTTSDSTNMDGWRGKNSAGQTIASVIWDFTPTINTNIRMGYIRGPSNTEFFFAAPAKYLTQGRYAYTYSLTFYLQQDNNTSPRLSTRGDVIIKGRYFNQVLVYSLTPPGTVFSKYEVKFLESYWKVGSTVGRNATSNELIRTLSSLESLWIRGQWTTLTDPTYRTRLMNIAMTFANKATTGSPAYSVETCQCPSQYVGQFCERCAPGWTRATPNGGAYTPCVPCSCNNHTDSCDAESGVCIGCQHNTTGDHCEKCADGLYGNATRGTSNDCQECPCPGSPFSSNSFARTCILDTDGQPSCTDCSTGHSGRRCEKCADGYYGTPTDPNNGQCRKCNCNGNVDPGVTGNCNTTTGECLKCLYNTTGSNCEWCAAGYHGNALTKSCQACNCTKIGSRDNICQNITGQCNCHPRVIGATCDQCEPNTFNYTSGEGCAVCGCHLQGSNKTQCDLVTGKCECNTNVIGDKCGMCNSHFYNVSKGCIACDCHANYTQPNTTCDVVTGQCACNVSKGGGKYGGRTCKTCAKKTVGKPEKCYACTEPCYDNWYGHIDIETIRVDVLNRSVSKMLDSFGGLSVESINNTLQELNTNLTSAEVVFKGAQYNTKEYQDHFDRIRSSIDSLQSRLNASRQALTETEQYLVTSVYGFNGTVQVTPQVYADGLSLTAIATAYRDRALAYNTSGHASYAIVLNSYNTIQIANVTAATAAKHVAEAMSKLDLVANQRSDVESRLGALFQSSLMRNNELLTQIQTVSNDITALVAAAKDARDKSMTSLNQTESTVKTANETAYQRRAQAQQALENAKVARTQATEAKTATTNAQTEAHSFKNNATGVLSQAQTALRNVTQGIKTIESVTNMTRDSETIAQSTLQKAMSVSLETIQTLAKEITSTPVNNTLINVTYDSAAEGLKKAREVEAISQKAIVVAQKTLSEVQSIKNNINSARTTRAETESLHKQTDSKVAEIKNITESVQSKFSSALTMGQETLHLINNTIQQVEDSLQCYNQSKQRAKTAADTAERAYNLSKEALKVNESITAVLPGASAEINRLHEIAKANYTDITSAHNDSVELLKDVREAEVLLGDYTQQREEMAKLKSEVEALEAELDTLNTQFDENLKRYESCGST